MLTRGLLVETRVGEAGNHFAWRPVPLRPRRPAVLALGGGLLLGAGASAGGTAGLLAIAGVGLMPTACAVVTGFVGLCMALGYALAPAGQRTGSQILGLSLSLGHALIFCALCVAVTVPAVRAAVAPWNAKVPFAEFLAAAPMIVSDLAALYVAAFTSFSLLAPLSLIIFRYTALRKSI